MRATERQLLKIRDCLDGNNDFTQVQAEDVETFKRNSIRNHQYGSKVFRKTEGFGSPVWNYFNPPIVQALRPTGTLKSKNVGKPNLNQQKTYLEYYKWANWMKVREFDMQKKVDVENVNLFDEVFSPSTYFPEIDENTNELFRKFPDIPYLGKEELSHLRVKCKKIREKMVKDKIRALRDLENIINLQLKGFDENIISKISSQQSLLEKLESPSLEEKERDDIMICSRTPLTDIIMKCDDALRVIFSFITSKVLLVQFCPSCRYFHRFIKENIPLKIKISSTTMDYFALDRVLSGFTVEYLQVGRMRKEYEGFYGSLISQGQRLIDFLFHHKNELREIRLFELENCQFGRLKGKGVVIYNKRAARTINALASACYKNGHKFFDEVKNCLRLEHLLTSILPNDISNLTNLKVLIYPINFFSLEPSPKKNLNMLSFPGNYRVAEDLQMLTKCFNEKKFPLLTEVKFVDGRIRQGLFNDTKARYSSLKSERGKEIMTKLHDSMRYLPNLERCALRMFLSFDLFSTEFVDFLTSQVKFVELYYTGETYDDPYGVGYVGEDDEYKKWEWEGSTNKKATNDQNDDSVKWYTEEEYVKLLKSQEEEEEEEDQFEEGEDLEGIDSQNIIPEFGTQDGGFLDSTEFFDYEGGYDDGDSQAIVPGLGTQDGGIEYFSNAMSKRSHRDGKFYIIDLSENNSRTYRDPNDGPNPAVQFIDQIIKKIPRIIYDFCFDRDEATRVPPTDHHYGGPPPPPPQEGEVVFTSTKFLDYLRKIKHTSVEGFHFHMHSSSGPKSDLYGWLDERYRFGQYIEPGIKGGVIPQNNYNNDDIIPIKKVFHDDFSKILKLPSLKSLSISCYIHNRGEHHSGRYSTSVEAFFYGKRVKDMKPPDMADFKICYFPQLVMDEMVTSGMSITNFSLSLAFSRYSAVRVEDVKEYFDDYIYDFVAKFGDVGKKNLVEMKLEVGVDGIHFNEEEEKEEVISLTRDVQKKIRSFFDNEKHSYLSFSFGIDIAIPLDDIGVLKKSRSAFCV